jgi:hypothetical protein
LTWRSQVKEGPDTLQKRPRKETKALTTLALQRGANLTEELASSSGVVDCIRLVAYLFLLNSEALNEVAASI